MMEAGLTFIGLTIAAATLAAILWSIAQPSRRIWPPIKYTTLTIFLVWVPTITLFGALAALGVLGWGELEIPKWARFGLGVPLIVIGNVAVWSEVARFGIAKTGGAIVDLQTDGLYQFSRNPQYMADIGMILGWMLLTATPLAILVGLATIIVLATAPFSEEPWLRVQYGADFDDYAARVRRFL